MVVRRADISTLMILLWSQDFPVHSTLSEPAAQYPSSKLCSVDDALGDQGEGKSMATVVRAGYLEEVGWPKLGGEQLAWRAQPRGPTTTTQAAVPGRAEAQRLQGSCEGY